MAKTYGYSCNTSTKYQFIHFLHVSRFHPFHSFHPFLSENPYMFDSFFLVLGIVIKLNAVIFIRTSTVVNSVYASLSAVFVVFNSCLMPLPRRMIYCTIFNNNHFCVNKFLFRIFRNLT